MVDITKARKFVLGSAVAIGFGLSPALATSDDVVGPQHEPSTSTIKEDERDFDINKLFTTPATMFSEATPTEWTDIDWGSLNFSWESQVTLKNADQASSGLVTGSIPAKSDFRLSDFKEKVRSFFDGGNVASQADYPSSDG